MFINLHYVYKFNKNCFRFSSFVVKHATHLQPTLQHDDTLLSESSQCNNTTACSAQRDHDGLVTLFISTHANNEEAILVFLILLLKMYKQMSPRSTTMDITSCVDPKRF